MEDATAFFSLRWAASQATKPNERAMVLEVLVDIRNFEPGWNAWRRRHCFSRLLVTLDLMRVPNQVAPLTESVAPTPKMARCGWRAAAPAWYPEGRVAV